MKIKPRISEKTIGASKKHMYTFTVSTGLTKDQASELISKKYGVHVKTVKSISSKKMVSKNYRGNLKVKPAFKKVIVTLADKEKIDDFDEKK